MLPGILLGGRDREHARIEIGYYSYKRVNDGRFRRRLIESDGQLFVVVQTEILKRLEGNILDFVNDRYVIVEPR